MLVPIRPPYTETSCIPLGSLPPLGPPAPGYRPCPAGWQSITLKRHRRFGEKTNSAGCLIGKNRLRPSRTSPGASPSRVDTPTCLRPVFNRRPGTSITFDSQKIHHILDISSLIFQLYLRLHPDSYDLIRFRHRYAKSNYRLVVGKSE